MVMIAHSIRAQAYRPRPFVSIYTKFAASYSQALSHKPQNLLCPSSVNQVIITHNANFAITLLIIIALNY